MLNSNGLKLVLFYLLMSCLYSCSSPSTVKIISTPSDAEVSVIDSNNVVTSLGKTPIVGNQSDIYKSSNNYTQLKIKKEGFLEQEIVLMKSTFGSETLVNVQLKKDELIQNIGEQSATQEKVASSIARANGLVQSKQYIEAEAIMITFIEQFPNVSVGYDYLGNINYLQKKYAKALKFYNRAISLNPQNTDRRIIVEKIQNIVKSQSGDL